MWLNPATTLVLSTSTTYSVNEEKHKSLHISHHLAALVPVLNPSVSDFYLINYLRKKAMSTISLVVNYKPAIDAYCL